MSSTDEALFQFIDIERLEVPNAEELINRDHLTDLFNRISREAYLASDTIIKLYLCATYNKFSIITRLKNKTEDVCYIIYDAYLVRVFRELNALYFFEDSTSSDVWKMSYRLTAEREKLRRNDTLASYAILNCYALGESDTKCEQDSSENDFFCHIQEFYILAHEIGHARLMNYGSEKPTHDMQEALASIFSYWVDNSLDADEVSLSRRAEEEISNNKSITEECICDAFAIMCVLKYVESDFSKTTDKKMLAFEAVYVCLMHIQLLSMHELGPLDVEELEITNSIRNQFFFDYVLGTLAPNEKPVFEKMIAACAEKYDQQILEEFLDALITLEGRLVNLSESVVECSM